MQKIAKIKLIYSPKEIMKKLNLKKKVVAKAKAKKSVKKVVKSAKKFSFGKKAAA